MEIVPFRTYQGEVISMLETIQKALVKLYGHLDLWESDEDLTADAQQIVNAIREA